MDLKLTNKRALVSGGSHGIGLAIAEGLAKEGCHVAILSRTEKRLEAASKKLKAHSVEVLTLKADVLKVEEIEAATAQLDKAWGGVDVLINNVGGGGRWGDPQFEKTDDTVWADVIDKNLMAAVRLTRWALPAMRRKKWGRVVTVSSLAGLQGGDRPWYMAAKASEIAFMKSLAVNPEIVQEGVTFNTVAPGGILIPNTGWEEMREKNSKEFIELLARDYPMGRLGSPEEVADTVLFICSGPASLLNGACIVVDGGQSRRIT